MIVLRRIADGGEGEGVYMLEAGGENRMEGWEGYRLDLEGGAQKNGMQSSPEIGEQIWSIFSWSKVKFCTA